MIHASYIKIALDLETFPYVIELLCKGIKKHAKVARAVAFRGASGALVGMSVCQKLGLPPILVRKKIDKAHSCRIAEGALDVSKIVIVDDMIFTGNTVRSIMDGIEAERRMWNLGPAPKCLGAFLYKEDSDTVGCSDIEWHGITIPVIGLRKNAHSGHHSRIKIRKKVLK